MKLEARSEKRGRGRGRERERERKKEKEKVFQAQNNGESYGHWSGRIMVNGFMRSLESLGRQRRMDHP